MSHVCVERVIGRLITDEQLLERFQADPAATLVWLIAQGFELTPIELASLTASSQAAWRELACTLDARLRKANIEASNQDNEPPAPKTLSRRGRTS